jgi:hypothetical protein
MPTHFWFLFHVVSTGILALLVGTGFEGYVFSVGIGAVVWLLFAAEKIIRLIERQNTLLSEEEPE